MRKMLKKLGINEVLKPSETQQEMVNSFADRAERVRNGNVDPRTDNMLKITNDGRKLALDQRLINDLLPDEPESKVNLCVENAYQVWEESTPDKSTQLIFCDLSTPKADGTFNVYDDVREKLVAKGIPREEIAFIHEANTETKKAELFAKVRSGQVRILLGSTPKLGAGTNIQDRLIALHHLDCPWKPSDLEQQEGRILRQGNRNQKVKIFRYVTENALLDMDEKGDDAALGMDEEVTDSELPAPKREIERSADSVKRPSILAQLHEKQAERMAEPKPQKKKSHDMEL